MFGNADTMTHSETFDTRQICGNNKRCRDFIVDYALHHLSQSEMKYLKLLKPFINQVYLYRVNPWSEATDGYAPMKLE